MFEKKLSHLIKRDGSVKDFDANKIVAAIAKAGKATGEFDESRAARITEERVLPSLVALNLVTPHIEQVQDAVERALFEEGFFYTTVPKLYTLLDTVNLDAAGITKVQNQPVLNLTGQDIILGFIDTGIDYTHPAFRRSDGTSRICGLWDQTVQSGKPPYDLEYGSAYTNEEINQALEEEDPFSVIPSRDDIGHGTALAGIAGGSTLPESDFNGAAPQSMIAVVKLKTAKKYLKTLFYVTGDAPAYQMTDIMAGIRYLLRLSEELVKPLVICLGLGTSQGDHSGDSPLDSMFSVADQFRGFIGVAAAGNEAGRGHHYYGTALNSADYNSVEILVQEGDTEGKGKDLFHQRTGLLT